MTQTYKSHPTPGQGGSGEDPLLESFATKIRQELDDSSFPKWEQAAEPLKVDVSTLSKWTARPHPSPMPAYRLVRWTKVMGPGLLRSLVRSCGYDLLALTPDGASPDPVSLIALFSRKAGVAVGQTIDDIASGGEWDQEERRADLLSWLQVQSTVDGIVSGIQGSLGGRAS